jgi:hypothetical protein
MGGLLDPEQPARTMSKGIAPTIPSRRRSRLVLGSRESSISTTISGTTCRIEIGGRGIERGGNVSAVVVTDTCASCGVVPSGAMTGVTTMHVVLAVGTIAQVSPTP